MSDPIDTLVIELEADPGIDTIIIQDGPPGPPGAGGAGSDLPAWVTALTSVTVDGEQLVIVSGGVTYLINALKQ